MDSPGVSDGRYPPAPPQSPQPTGAYTTIVDTLHKAARQFGCKVQVRRFDAEAATCRVTFRVAQP